MNYWRNRFVALNYSLPEPPRTPELDKYREVIYNELKKVTYWDNLLTSDEPKTIVKLPATDFQKSKFKENYTFVFQSLITGRKSQFIPYKERPVLGITDDDKRGGGVWPELFNFANNGALVSDYYYTLLRRLWKRQMLLMQDYYRGIDEAKHEWRILYTEYLSSNDWKTIRDRRIEFDDYNCVMCSSTIILQVHHLTYKNVGEEDFINDLITLCKSCHSAVHGRQL